MGTPHGTDNRSVATTIMARVRGFGRVRLMLGLGVVVVASVLSLSVFGAAAQEAPAQSAQRDASDDAPRHEVIANLFEWNWHSVANECATVLGPKGYGGVQVAPPQDSLFKPTRPRTRGGRCTSLSTTT